MNLASTVRAALLMVVAVTATMATAALPRERFAQTSSAPASRPFAGRMSPRGEGGPQERQELMEFLRQNMPELARQLEALHKANPAVAERQFRQIEGLYRRVKDYPPELRQAALARGWLNVAILRTAQQLRAAKPEDKPKLEERIKALISEQFDKEMIVRQYELERLTKQLAKLQEQLDQHKANRDKIIQNKLQRVERWTSATQPGSQPASQPATENSPERGGI